MVDGESFDRMFGFDKPQDVPLIHSFYWEVQPVEHGVAMLHGATTFDQVCRGTNRSAALAVPAMPDPTTLDSCGDKKPEWFLLINRLMCTHLWERQSSSGQR